jgi:hypothetical protein
VTAPQYNSNFFPRTALRPLKQFLRRSSVSYKEQYSEFHAYVMLAEISSVLRPPRKKKSCCTDEILRAVSTEKPNHHKFIFHKQRRKKSTYKLNSVYWLLNNLTDTTYQPVSNSNLCVLINSGFNKLSSFINLKQN